jgi:dipeptidyl aminopeptidase/acylaminoacyl peptidase
LATVDNQEFRRQLSPENYWDHARAPVSIHVGTADQVTPPKWAQAIRDGLQRAAKPVEYFEYEGQGHSFRGAAESELEMRVQDFFDRYLK